MAKEKSDGNRVTLREVAARTGYSINTVSHALRDKTDISEATQKKIREAAREMGYIANEVAGSLRSGHTKTVAVIVGDISNPHFSILIKEIEECARTLSFTTIVMNTDEDEDIEEQAIVAAVSKNTDGIIICPSQKSGKNIGLMRRNGVPYVLMGRCPDDSDTVSDFVSYDNVKGGYLATSHLLDRGHRRILFLNGSPYISSSKERLEGYRLAFAERGLSPNDSLVHEVPIIAKGCLGVLRKLLAEGLDFTAILAFSDVIACESIYTLNREGYAVPDDIAVVGFDDIQSRLLISMPLTSIGPSAEMISKRAFSILIDRIKGGPKTPIVREVLDVKLVCRESSDKVRSDE